MFHDGIEYMYFLLFFNNIIRSFNQVIEKQKIKTAQKIIHVRIKEIL